MNLWALARPANWRWSDAAEADSAIDWPGHGAAGGR